MLRCESDCATCVAPSTSMMRICQGQQRDIMQSKVPCASLARGTNTPHLHRYAGIRAAGCVLTCLECNTYRSFIDSTRSLWLVCDSDSDGKAFRRILVASWSANSESCVDHAEFRCARFGPLWSSIAKAGTRPCFSAFLRSRLCWKRLARKVPQAGLCADLARRVLGFGQAHHAR